MSDEGVLILAGATGTGKTELAVELTQRFGAEIVGADARQIYRDMPVGTAAPSPQQLATVPHHLVGFLDPHERYSAARYAADALDAIAAIRARGRRIIVAGGTGFYLRALLGGVALAPQHDYALRDRLAREGRIHTADFLHGWLACRDSPRARALHSSDRYRVLRALEVALAPPPIRETPARSLRSEKRTPLLVFLDVPWDVVDRRIAQRTKEMISAGLVEEAERVGAEAVAANAVGYPQALAFLRGWCSGDEMRVSIERATRRYARRQRAWFRGEPATVWLSPERVEAAVREKLGWSANRE